MQTTKNCHESILNSICKLKKKKHRRRRQEKEGTHRQEEDGVKEEEGGWVASSAVAKAGVECVAVLTSSPSFSYSSSSPPSPSTTSNDKPRRSVYDISGDYDNSAKTKSDGKRMMKGAAAIYNGGGDEASATALRKALLEVFICIFIVYLLPYFLSKKIFFLNLNPELLFWCC